jgi:hypothetical protein
VPPLTFRVVRDVDAIAVAFLQGPDDGGTGGLGAIEVGIDVVDVDLDHHGATARASREHNSPFALCGPCPEPIARLRHPDA